MMDFIEEFFQKIELLKRSSSELYFRGQSNSSWSLQSSLSRKYYDEYNKASSEIEKAKIILKLILQEQEKFIEFKQTNNKDMEVLQYVEDRKEDLKLIKPFEIDNEKNILALMQHYNFPTRCLDLTSNLLVALYFSLPEDLSQEENSSLWVIDKNKLIERYFNKSQSRYSHIDFPYEKKISLKTSLNYSQRLQEMKMLYEKRICDLEDPLYYGRNELGNEFNESISLIKMDIEDAKVLGYERHSTLEENLYCGGLNERLCRQDGVFILQSFIPLPIEKEFENSQDTRACLQNNVS